jgi:hypothetical protein
MKNRKIRSCEGSVGSKMWVKTRLFLLLSFISISSSLALSTFHNRIIGGVDAEPGEFPWQVKNERNKK